MESDTFSTARYSAGDVGGEHRTCGWTAPWATYRSEVDEIVDLGDRVVRWELYPERAQALEAAGLSE
jgi:hypothetical protein